MAKKKAFVLNVRLADAMGDVMTDLVELSDAARGPGVEGSIEDLTAVAQRAAALARDAADAACMLMSVAVRRSREEAIAMLVKKGGE